MISLYLVCIRVSFLHFPSSYLIFTLSLLLHLLVGISHQYWINHQYYTNKTDLLMVNIEYILSYSSCASHWKVSHTNLVLKLLTAIPTSASKSPHSKCSPGELQDITIIHFFLTISSDGHSPVHQRRTAYTTFVQKEFQHSIQVLSSVWFFLSPQ